MYIRSTAVSHWLITKYDTYTPNSLQDIRKSQWTMKYRSQWPTNFLAKMLDHYTVSPSQSMMFIHQIVFKIQCKITRPWNIGHSDIQLFWGQTLEHTDSYSQSMMFMHQESSRQNHWSKIPFILRSSTGSYRLIIPKYTSQKKLNRSSTPWTQSVSQISWS